MGINWGTYFDAIYCLSLADFTERRQLMEKELQRVGILDSDIFHWKVTVRNEFYKYIWSNSAFNTPDWWRNLFGNMNCTMGHYEIMKECIARNYDRVLIIEDDVRFLKNMQTATLILDNIPQADIIMFDKNVADRPREQLMVAAINGKVNDYYFSFDTVSLGSTGCYALSKKAMQTITIAQEREFMPADFPINKTYDDGLVRVTSNTNLAIQDMTLKGDKINDIDKHLYEDIANLEDYNL